MATTNLNIRTDKDIKEQADQIFSELGLNMTTAINMFLRTTIRENGIPFSLKLDTPNEETAAAIEEDLKLAKKQNKDLNKLFDVVNILAEGGILGAKYRDHDLSGEYKGIRECHVEPDWLLVYEIQNDVLVLILYRLGTHSELFKK